MFETLDVISMINKSIIICLCQYLSVNILQVYIEQTELLERGTDSPQDDIELASGQVTVAQVQLLQCDHGGCDQVPGDVGQADTGQYQVSEPGHRTLANVAEQR